jgi:hypothetical protein
MPKRLAPSTMHILASCSQANPGSLTTGKGNRCAFFSLLRENFRPTRQQSRHSFILANTEVLHDKIGVLSSRVRQLEDALSEAYAMYNSERHPLLSDELLQIKRPLERESRNEIPSLPEAETAEAIDAVGSL